MYEEVSVVDEISETIAQSITDITGKEFRPEDMKIYKPRDKTKDN